MEVSESAARLYDSAVAACFLLSVCQSLCHFHLSKPALPLLVCLPTHTHLNTYTHAPIHTRTHLTPTVSYLPSLSHFLSSLSAGAQNVTDALNGVESLQVETEQIFLMSLEVFHIFHSLHHQKRGSEICGN